MIPAEALSARPPPGASDARPATAKGRPALRVAVAGVALLTIAVYLRALGNEFVPWDDPDYVYGNRSIAVLDLAFLKWAFTSFHAGNWHPLTWISHALDYRLWALKPFGHHLTSILLHAVNTALVLLLGVRLVEAHATSRAGPEETAGTPRRFALVVGAVAALLFGLHPAHVESVAWVSERKDVLCAAFYLGGLLLYLRYAQPARPPGVEGPGASRRRRVDYALMTGLFVLAILSKPMAVTFPIVLLVLDAFPLRRLSRARDLVALVAEKLPLVAISAASCGVTLLAQRDARTPGPGFPLGERLMAASTALTGYLAKMAWPDALMPIYPHPLKLSRDLLSSPYVVPLVLNVAVTIACIAAARRTRGPAAAWAYYVLTLLPVIGIVQVGEQGMADRYTYLPSVAPFLLVGAGAAMLWESAERRASGAGLRKASLLAAGVAVVVALSARTVVQIAVWRDGESLWSHQLAVMQEERITHPWTSSVAHMNRGLARQLEGDPLRAIADYTAAMALYPLSHGPYVDRGDAYFSLGRYEEASSDYDMALQVRKSPEVYLQRALAQAKLGRDEEAVRDYSSALAQDFGAATAEIHYNRGNAYARLGRVTEALEDYTRAIERSSGSHPDYFRNRAWALRKLGRDAEAARDAARAQELTSAPSPAGR